MQIRLLFFVMLFTVTSTAWTFNLAPQPVPFSASDASFLIATKQHRLSEYKGRKVMLWLFSTWCHTCIASVKKLHQYQARLEKTGLLILAVRNFNNGGVAGLLMTDFIRKIQPEILQYKNWQLAEATAELDKMLNTRKFPDIYFLIDEQGVVQKVDTAPNIHMQSILHFAQQTIKR